MLHPNYHIGVFRIQHASLHRAVLSCVDPRAEISAMSDPHAMVWYRHALFSRCHPPLLSSWVSLNKPVLLITATGHLQYTRQLHSGAGLALARASLTRSSHSISQTGSERLRSATSHGIFAFVSSPQAPPWCST